MKERTSQRSSGFVLLAVLVIVMLASMVALSLMFRLRTEEKGASAGRQGEQAWAAAVSGLARAMSVAASKSPWINDWMDDPSVFREQLVADDGAEQWYFTVYTYGPAERAGVIYGVTDEASRLDIRATHEDLLMKLPKMSRGCAASLRDFVDPDRDARQEGAEQEYYDELPLPIVVPNGAPSSLDQILLVRGFTPAVFYGEDANLNHELDPNEDDGPERLPPDDDNGALDRGMRQYLTVWASDPNVDNKGAPRINVNVARESLEGLGLPAATLTCLQAMRESKSFLSFPSDLLETTFTVRAANGTETKYPSAVSKVELPLVLDRLCTTNLARSIGLLNVNTASIYLLQTVPGIDAGVAEAIVNARPFLAPEKRSTIGWLFTEGIMDAAHFRLAAPVLTARSYQFRCQVIGYSHPSGTYRILEATFDLATGRPHIIYLRDVTRLGPPFPLQPDPLTTHG